MPTWLNVVLEIVKITIPALIVFLTVYYLLKTYLDKQYQLKLLEFKQNQKDTTIPLRLQAYERLSLFCERISIPNLTLRLKTEDQTVASFRLALLMTIQQEFEYNITQQVYVSGQLWQIIKIARDNTVGIIEAIAGELSPKAPSSDLVNLLLKYVDSEASEATGKALEAIKKEASILM